MRVCPPLEQLQSLLAEELTEPELAALTKHLEACRSCRQTLDQLSADADSRKWRRLRVAEPTPPPEPPAGFFRRLEAIAPSSLPPTPPPPPAEPPPPPDGYQILEAWGRGGSGVVYKARHLK